MINLGDYIEKATVYCPWPTNDKNGAAIDPSAAGTIKVYKNNDTTEITAPTGITDTRTFDGTTGIQQIVIDTTANTFYVKKADYFIVLVTATIDSETVSTVIAIFSIQNRWSNIHYHYGGK